MNEIVIMLLATVGTCITYVLATRIYNKIQFPLFIPIIVAPAIIIIFLMLSNISYETYMVGGGLISQLLGPAVVALAYPLYKQRKLLKQLAGPITVGTFIGALIGISTGVLFTKWLNFNDEIIYSILPKSVTTPIAMEVSTSLGGITSLAVVFVIIAGVSGAVLSRYIYKLFRITHFVGRGVGIGSGSHAIGTAKALENGQTEGSVSTVAMILSMVFVSVLAPLLINYLL